MLRGGNGSVSGSGSSVSGSGSGSGSSCFVVGVCVGVCVSFGVSMSGVSMMKMLGSSSSSSSSASSSRRSCLSQYCMFLRKVLGGSSSEKEEELQELHRDVVDEQQDLGILRTPPAKAKAFSQQSDCNNNDDSAEKLHKKNSSSWLTPTRLDSRRQDMHDPSPRAREEILTWDDYFMNVAFLSARRSKDPHKRVGACVVSPRKIILGIGYNGFPRGCADDDLPWSKVSKRQDNTQLDTKHPYVCHAEVNAIMNTETRASLHGSRIYVTLFPCNECTKLIIQSGISQVVYYESKAGAEGFHDENAPPPVNENFGVCKPCAVDAKTASFMASRRMLDLAGVQVRQHVPQQSM